MDQGLRLRISLCFWIPMSTTYCQKHWTQDQIWSTSLWQLLQNSCQRFSVDKQQEELVNCNSRADFDLNLSKLKVTWNDLELEERRKKKMSEDAKFFLYFEKTRLKCCPSLMTKSCLTTTALSQWMRPWKPGWKTKGKMSHRLSMIFKDLWWNNITILAKRLQKCQVHTS